MILRHAINWKIKVVKFTREWEKKSFHWPEGIPCTWRVLRMRHSAIDGKEVMDERKPINFFISFCVAWFILFLFKTIPRGSGYSIITFPWRSVLFLINKFVVVLFLSDYKFSTLALNIWSKINLIIIIGTRNLKSKDEKIINGLVVNQYIPHLVRFEPNISIVHCSFFYVYPCIVLLSGLIYFRLSYLVWLTHIEVIFC